MESRQDAIDTLEIIHSHGNFVSSCQKQTPPHCLREFQGGVLEALEISRWTYSSHLSAEGLSWDIPGDAQVSSGAKSREKYNPPIICILPWTCFPLHLGTQASDNKAAPRDRGHRKGELHNLATASLRSRTGCRSHRSLPLLLGVKGRKG
jgi:hypothetical protein